MRTDRSRFPYKLQATSYKLLKDILQFGTRLFIILFCVWHLAAIALYSIPAEAADPLSMWLKQQTIPIVRPYLYWTSQWQQWNLFAPDPLRRVTLYSIERWTDGGWHTMRELTPHSLPFWRDADELKLLRRLEDGGERWAPLRQRYIEIVCMEEGLPAGTTLRLMISSAVLPKPERPMPRSYYLTWEKSWESRSDVTAVCGESSSSPQPQPQP